MPAGSTTDHTDAGAGAANNTQAAQMPIAGRLADDPEIGAAQSLASVNEAKSRRGLGVAEIASIVMQGYADRPALGEIESELVTDPATGQRVRRLSGRFRTITYRQLWQRAESLAAVWHNDPNLQIRAGDFVCMLAFAGTDYVVIDLATLRIGAVSVPLPANATVQQLQQIVMEAQPKCFAASIDHLETAVDIILAGVRPASLIVFSYHADDDRERGLFEAARARLERIPVIVDTLDALCARGATLTTPPLSSTPNDGNALATIYYTSGSTGSPKGAMYPQRMMKAPWLAVQPTPLICVHYMPLNHTFGRTVICMTLANGGTCYFTAKEDLSSLFEDIRSVRPTHLSLVPRICEMIFHFYQVELERRGADDAIPGKFDDAALTHVRINLLGGRVMASGFGGAPMGAELTAFTEACLGIKLSTSYGTTEVSIVTFNGKIMRPPVIDYKLVDVPELGYFRTDKPYPRGELLVKSSNVMLGYHKRPEVTAQMFDEAGYYKTGDIMAETATDTLVYLDRRNNVLKLAQGEFVSLATLEYTFTSGHPLIHQFYLYGKSEWSYLLAVIVPHFDSDATTLKDADLAAMKPALRAAIKQIAAKEGLQTYEVPRDFLVETEPFSVQNGLLTGVGKFQRPALKARYAELLERLYADIADKQADELRQLRRGADDVPIITALTRAIKATLGIDAADLDQSRSFNDLGGDSLAALSFSKLLEEMFKVEVPVGVIVDSTSNLGGLATYIERMRSGAVRRSTFAATHGRGATSVRAMDLTLDRFIDSSTLQAASDLAPAPAHAKTVLLTGANGFLGRFLCLEWLERLAQIGGKVICIARGRDGAAARKRLRDAFDSGDAGLLARFDRLAAEHLEVMAGDIAEDLLGLARPDWDRLAESVDLIVHPAALVNHILPYDQLFGPNVVGTAELIRLALTTRRKAFNYVSTMATAFVPGGKIATEDDDIRIVSPVRPVQDETYASGYGSSKWAGEVLLRDAHERFDLPIAVFRPDMILAHSKYSGQLNVPDMFTRWLFSVSVTGLAPRSFYRPSTGGSRPHYDGLPVDFIAQAIAAIGQRETSGYRSYHVLNPHNDGISLDQFVDWAIDAGLSIGRIDDYDDWFVRFETALRALPETQRNHSSLMLLHQLRRPAPVVAGSMVPAVRFAARVKELGVGPEGRIPHLSATLIRKYLDDFRALSLI